MLSRGSWILLALAISSMACLVGGVYSLSSGRAGQGVIFLLTGLGWFMAALQQGKRSRKF